VSSGLFKIDLIVWGVRLLTAGQEPLTRTVLAVSPVASGVLTRADGPSQPPNNTLSIRDRAEKLPEQGGREDGTTPDRPICCEK
jgi:hypothetical protein